MRILRNYSIRQGAHHSLQVLIPPPVRCVDPPWFSRFRIASSCAPPGSPAAEPLRGNDRLRRRGGACPRPFCRTQVFVGGRFVNRPYGGSLVSAVGARPRAPRRPDPSFLDPFRHGACVRRAATHPRPLSGEARAAAQSPPRLEGGDRAKRGRGDSG